MSIWHHTPTVVFTATTAIFSLPPEIVSTGHNNPAGLHYNIYDNILAVPNHDGGTVDFLEMFVQVACDSNLGNIPMDIAFTGISDLEVAEWKWFFGDGDSAMTQNCIHTYTSTGLFDISLTAISTDNDTITRYKKKLVAGVADTLKADTTGAMAGEVAQITISLNNSIPIENIKIPVDYSASNDGYTTAGNQP